MTSISIRMAQNDEDIEVARALCRDWLNWHWKAYPKDWPVEGNPMDPVKFQDTLRDLPKIHARPGGGIVIAFVDGTPAGCVMYNKAESGVAEFNRMFVHKNGRGHGIGRLMLDHMFEAMRADGYERVMFSSATFLEHARRMYENAGFKDMPIPNGFPDQWRDYVYFMQRAL